MPDPHQGRCRGSPKGALAVADKFVEDDLEQAIIEYLKKTEGYIHVDGKTMPRKFTDVLIEDDTRAYLRNKYQAEALTDNELTTAINRIKLVPSSPLYVRNKETFRLLNEGFTISRDDASKPKLFIDLIDFDKPANNIYKVVNQYTVEDIATRRPDLLFFINGIPVCICEFKSAIKEDTTIMDAWKQIHIRYSRDIPSLLRYCALSMITDGANSKLGTIFTPYEYYYAWRKTEKWGADKDGINALFSMLSGAFRKERLTELIRDFVCYPDSDEKETAIVCRYPQYFAANAMFDSIRGHLRPDGDGKGGTYFGATGCGKTYTILFLARKLILRDKKRLKNPTIIIITDRDDLDTQTAELFTDAKTFLHDDNVRSIESRKDLRETLGSAQSGGVYMITIQKFCEEIGLLSDRNNIICISDEAHRTQTNVSATIKVTEQGIKERYGFARYLREAFPNATYAGFTGTPIDETLAVFGDVVDQYTMKESCADGITVPIAYEPRLARVLLDDERAHEIQKYYEQCAQDGSNPQQVEESKKAMSRMSVLLSHPDRMAHLAQDIVEHYERLCEERPEVVQKAMIVCDDRARAYDLMKRIIALRPEWAEKKRADDEDSLTKEELEQLKPLERIKVVATRDKDDPKELYDALGADKDRRSLDRQFKNIKSNFRIAIVVDMWITGFDVPSLSVMYIDKPLKKHTLIQTISRVNRVYSGKPKGLVVDYIGIRDDMLRALKTYGGEQEIADIQGTIEIFRNHLDLLDKLMAPFDAHDFYNSEKPLARLMCLNRAAEFVQKAKDTETRFMNMSRIMKQAYEIAAPSGELTDDETRRANFYLALRSIIYKQTKGDAPDAETMNRHVERMVREAIQCSEVENIINYDEPEDLFGDELTQKAAEIKLPISKFNALLKLLEKAISSYGKKNRIKAIEFDKRLRAVVERYNSRDNLTFVSETVEDFVNTLSDELIEIMNELHDDKTSFEKLGISFEEKVFYDILVKVRDEHQFEYADDKCVALAKEIKKLVDDKAQYVDFAKRADVKNQLNQDLTVLLYRNGYPPQWNDQVFEEVMTQAENYKLNVG